MTQNKKGFTLIELVVVMAIIAVIAMLGVGAIMAARSASKVATHKANAKTLQTGIESYFAKTSGYPAAVAGVTFTSVSTTVGVNLAAATECPAAQAGGGQVTITATGYTITPYDANCTAALVGATNVITGP